MVPAAIFADDRLLNELRAPIDAGREQAARAVNSALIGLYWQIGRRIRQDILQEQRAEYGQQIVTALSARLTAEYGKGFSRPNLFRMVQFAEAYPDEQIVSSLMRQLSWTHLICLVPIKDPLKRDFYAGQPVRDCIRPPPRPLPLGAAANRRLHLDDRSADALRRTDPNRQDSDTCSCLPAVRESHQCAVAARRLFTVWPGGLGG